MTEGTSQGLFIVVAIVIFGIFVALAYIMFEDTLSPALAGMFNDAGTEAYTKLTDDYLPSQPVKITDSNLKVAIKQALSLSDSEIEHLTYGDISEVTSLNLSGKNISNLEGLQYFKGLQTLNLSNNKLSDLSSLPNIQGLKTLNVSKNSLKSLDGVGKLESLTTLNIADNQVNNIASVSTLSNLVTFEATNNKLTNVSALSKLESLKIVKVKGNDNVDLRSIRGMVGLTLTADPQTKIGSITMGRWSGWTSSFERNQTLNVTGSSVSFDYPKNGDSEVYAYYVHKITGITDPSGIKEVVIHSQFDKNSANSRKVVYSSSVPNTVVNFSTTSQWTSPRYLSTDEAGTFHIFVTNGDGQTTQFIVNF